MSFAGTSYKCITRPEYFRPDDSRTALVVLHHVRSNRLESETRRSAQNASVYKYYFDGFLDQFQRDVEVNVLLERSIAENGGKSL